MPAYTEGAWLFFVRMKVLVLGDLKDDESPLPEGRTTSPERQFCRRADVSELRREKGLGLSTEDPVVRQMVETYEAWQFQEVGSPGRGAGRVGRGEGRGSGVGVVGWGAGRRLRRVETLIWGLRVGQGYVGRGAEPLNKGELRE